jgi:hypothetical protein
MKRNGWTRAAWLAALAGALLVSGSHNLCAQKVQTGKAYMAVLTGAQEVPSVDTPAVGVATFSLGSDGKLLYEVTATGLKGKPTAMHLHRGKAGVAGEVIYPLTTPSVDAVTTGTVDFKAADVADLDSQGFYINIHTESFPGGEIRGQVLVPPPGVTVSLK